MNHSLDRRIAEASFAIHGKYPWLDRMAVFCARVLIVLLFIVEVVVFIRLYWILDGWHAWSTDQAAMFRDLFLGFRLPFSLLVMAWLFSVTIEVLVARPRPFKALGKNPLDHFWVPTPSMPSSHTAVASALTLAMFALSVPAGIAFAVTTLFIGASRVYAGVHYFSDILVGIAVGMFASFVLIHVFPV